jgi:hypothetical protein
MTCSPTAGLSADAAALRLSIDVKAVELLYTFQRKVFLPLPTVAAVAFVVSAIALGIYKRTEKRPSTNQKSIRLLSTSRLVSMCSAWSLAALLLAASWTITMSTKALQVASQNSGAGLQLEAGVSLQALQWIAGGLACVYALGIGTMVRSRSNRQALQLTSFKAPLPPRNAMAAPPETQTNPFQLR